MTGSFLRWTPDVIVSLNELEFTVRKAVRGAGYHWGEAEEAGKAAVWLARRGLPTAEPLLTVLRSAKHALPRLRSTLGNGVRTDSGVHCPLLTGIAIGDGAVRLEAGTPVLLEQILSPILLLPFIALAASGSDRAIAVAWPGAAAVVLGDEVRADLDGAASDQPVTTTFRIADTEGTGTPRPVVHKTLDVDAAAWDALNAFAAETYVPATDRSRLAGAGAGLADND